jgi:S-DNA-T family DNA segregation ATPase FtsK/SpoIIIE
LKGESVIANIEDVIEAVKLRNHADERPLIAHKHREEWGWHVCLSLPWGISSKDVRKHEDHFTEQTGASHIDWQVKGRLLHMDVVTTSIPERVKYAPTLLEGLVPLPIGASARGPVVADLADVIALLIAGVPGSGKSNQIHVILNALLRAKVLVCAVDLKKLEYSYARNCAAICTNNEQARLMLTALNKELNRRLDLLEKEGFVNVKEHGKLPYICLIIDELTELTDEDSQELLNRILRLGRAAGILVIAATQRPSSKTFRDFTESRGLFSATLCFRVRDATNSRMVLDNDRAALLPRIKGRAIWQYGDQEAEVQTYHLPVSDAKRMVREIEQPATWSIQRQSDSVLGGPKALPGHGADSVIAVPQSKVRHEEGAAAIVTPPRGTPPKKVAARQV